MSDSCPANLWFGVVSTVRINFRIASNTGTSRRSKTSPWSRRKTSIRCSFAQNIARITVEDGHFLLLAGTFQDPRVVHYGGVRSERQLREHVEEIFGNYFTIKRAETTVIKAVAGQEGKPVVAFWMVRKPAWSNLANAEI